MELTPEQRKIAEILYPYHLAKQDRVKALKQRFVHYTSADVVMSILTKRLVWMRNATAMNDFSEMRHGKKCLIEAYAGEPGTKLKAALDQMHDGFSADLETRFNSWIPHFEQDTYVTCFSEHDTAEDDTGRLSMWRAYGRRNGVALVVNNTAFVSASDALKAYTSPVAYITPAEFSAHLMSVALGIERNSELMKTLGYDLLMGSIFNVFRMGMLCAKHHGFKEEREWRVVYNPTFESSDYIAGSMEVVNGVPQLVYKIPTENIPEENFVGANPRELIDRIIIGPTQDGWVMYKAFVQALIDLGFEDAAKRVVISGIPLRT